jgi:phage terminase large subunit GpA-like protein
MFCQNCGSKIADGAKFCPDCGTRIQIAEGGSEKQIIVSENTETIEENGTELSFDEETVVDTSDVNEYYTKCNKCGENFVIKKEKAQEGGVYKCPKCHEQLKITFFGHCNKCKKPIGFWEFSWGNTVSGIGKAVLKGIFNPGSAIDALERFTDKIPVALKAGDCPFCDHYYIKCPKCDSAVQFPVDGDIKTVVVCEKCDTKMRRPLDEVNKIKSSILSHASTKPANPQRGR